MRQKTHTMLRNRIRLAAAAGALLWTAGTCLAQGDAAKPPTEAPKFFHLDFVVKELDAGKVINARHYSSITAAGDTGFCSCTMRSGNKVPVTTEGAAGAPVLTYIDVGVNIDCRAVKEIEGSLALNLTAEISNTANATHPPIIRQTKWSSNAVVPIGKPTVIFSADDLASKGQMQLELTATPIPLR